MWVGFTDSAAAAWFVHHLLYFTVVYLWTLYEPATLLSASFQLIFCEYLYLSFLPFFASLFPCPFAKESTSLFLQLAPFLSPCCFTSSLISFSPSLLSVFLFSAFLPFLHPSPHSDAMPLCHESRGCRFTEPQRKV